MDAPLDGGGRGGSDPGTRFDLEDAQARIKRQLKQASSNGFDCGDAAQSASGCLVGLRLSASPQTLRAEGLADWTFAICLALNAPMKPEEKKLLLFCHCCAFVCCRSETQHALAAHACCRRARKAADHVARRMPRYMACHVSHVLSHVTCHDASHVTHSTCRIAEETLA